ncbi:hypothetical protein [Helicobacter fennelliae]|uniref:hypothetical protein n=1 Tax=Helicobacter fennelliae TaxID=215 RepID=UPI0011BE0BC5|nr:hypothetical protein [Helicobacter fennelliae]
MIKFHTKHYDKDNQQASKNSKPLLFALDKIDMIWRKFGFLRHQSWTICIVGESAESSFVFVGV